MATGVSEDLILSVDYALLSQLAPPLLRDEDTRIDAATFLARRLQLQVDSPSETAAVVRLMCTHCACDNFLLQLFLELLVSIEHKAPVIHSIALSAVDATEQQIQAVLDAYRELLVQDRAFLVPIVGSISELQLTPAQRESFLSLVEGSLSLVDDGDVPTMVSALLQLTTAVNAVKIIRVIRTEAVHVTIEIATLLASPMVASIRARSPCARAYIAELSRTAPLTSMDVLVVAGLLQVPSMRRAVAGALFAAIRIHPPAVDILRATLSSHAGNDPANIHFVYVTLQQSFGSLSAADSSSSRRRAASSWQRLDPSLLLSVSIAVSEAIIRHHPPLRKQGITALLTACATKMIGDSAGHVLATETENKPPGEAKGRRATKGANGGGWCKAEADCARIAACTLVHIAEVDAACLKGCSDQLCQFYGQHAAVCDNDVLHLISATLSRIIAYEHSQTRGKDGGGGDSVRGISQWRDADVGHDRDEDGSMGPLGTYSAVMLIIQKLFVSIRPEMQHSALILSGHVLQRAHVPESDAQTMQRNASRLALDPSCPSAREMYLFVLNALPSLSRGAKEGMLNEHLLPALIRSGIVRKPHAPTDCQETITDSVTSEGGAVSGGQMAGSNGLAGGQSVEDTVLSVHTCVQQVLQCTKNRRDAHRFNPLTAFSSMAGCSLQHMSARAQTRQTFVNTVALLECCLLYRSLCAHEESAGCQKTHKEAGGRAVPGDSEGSGGMQAFVEACGWQIEMPADLHMDFSALEAPGLEHMSDALRIGWSCYLNFAAGMIFCSLACISSECSTANPSSMVLGRLVQSMQCRQHLQDALLPFLAHCQRVVARSETRSTRQNRAGVASQEGDGLDGQGDEASVESRPSNGECHDESGQEDEAKPGSAAAERVFGSLTARAQALHDVCTGNWEVEVPEGLLCVGIAALEPHGLATQKALLEMLRLVNHRLRCVQHAAILPYNESLAMAWQSRLDSEGASGSPAAPSRWAGAAGQDGANITGGMLQAWMHHVGLESPLHCCLTQSKMSKAVETARSSSNCDGGGSSKGIGKGKEAMSDVTTSSGVCEQDGVQDGDAGRQAEPHCGDNGRRLAWQVLSQCGQGQGDLLLWLGMQIVPLIASVHEMRTGMQDEDSVEEQVAGDAEEQVEDAEKDGDDEDWTPSSKSARKTNKIASKGRRNGARATNGWRQGAGPKRRGRSGTPLAKDGKLSVCLKLLGEIYCALTLLVRHCALHGRASGHAAADLSSERCREIGTTLHCALCLGREARSAGGDVKNDHGADAGNGEAGIDGSLTSWAGVFHELELVTQDIEDAALAALHVSLLAALVALVTDSETKSHSNEAAGTPCAPASTGLPAQAARARLAHVVAKSVCLVYPLGASTASSHILLDPPLLAPAGLLWLTGAGGVGPRQGHGASGGGVTFVGAAGGGGCRRIAAYSALMSAAMELLPAADALSLAESLLVVASRGCVAADAAGGAPKSHGTASKKKTRANGGVGAEGAEGRGSKSMLLAATLGVDSKRAGSASARGAWVQEVCLAGFPSVAGDTVDDLVAPLLVLVTAPFSAIWAFESEESCRNALLALVACVSLCVKMLLSSQPRASLLNHPQFQTQVARVSLKLIMHLRRDLSSLLHEAARLLDSAEIRRGIVRDLLHEIQSLITVHSDCSVSASSMLRGGAGANSLGCKRKLADSEPKAELERSILSGAIGDLIDVYHIKLGPSGYAAGGGAGVAQAARRDQETAADDKESGDVDVSWRRAALHRFTLAELIWGARVVSGDEDGGDAGFGAGEDGFYSNTETETDSDTEGIEGFHGVRSRKTPRMHA